MRMDPDLGDIRILMMTARGSAVERQKGMALGACLLYTSDAADERSSVDLGGRRIIQKKKQ